MAHKYSFKDVEEYLLSLEKIKLRFPNTRKPFEYYLPKDIKEYVRVIISCSTFFDTFKMNGDLYCDSSRYRSIGDLWRISRNINASVSFELFYSTMMQLIKERVISSFICKDVHRRVYVYGSWYDNGRFNKPTTSFLSEPTDEFEFDITEFNLNLEELGDAGRGMYGEGHSKISLCLEPVQEYLDNKLQKEKEEQERLDKFLGRTEGEPMAIG